MQRSVIILIFACCLFANGTKAQKSELEKGNNAYFNKQYELAVRHYGNYLKEIKKGFPLIFFRRGESYLKIGKFAEAVADFSEVLKMSPAYDKAHYNRGLAYKQSGKYETAILDFDRELRQAERNNTTEWQIELLKLIGECYAAMGAHEKADDYARRAAQLEAALQKSSEELPSPSARTNNTPSTRPTGQQQTAEPAPPSAAQLLSEARALTESQKYVEAEQKCTQVINRYKDMLKQAYDLRGQIRIRLERYKEAVQDFDRSLQLDSRDAWTFNQRGVAKMKMGLLDQAEQDFNSAVNLDPHSAARQNLNDLNILKRRSLAENDRQGPFVAILTPQLAEEGSRGLSVVSTNDSSITIVGIVEDISGVREVQINTTIAKLIPADQAGQKFRFSATVPVKQYGENKLYLVAKDAGNNATYKTYTYSAVPNATPAFVDKQSVRKLIGKNYALLIGIDEYDHWVKLNNPVHDVKTLAEILKKIYGFEIELLINPKTKEEIEQKIQQWANRNYNYNDQLFVFIAGHGYFHDHLKKGFIIPANGYPPQYDLQGATWVSHDFIRNTLDHSNSHHVFLVIDACFSGTISPAIALSRGEVSTLSIYETVARKIQLKTRKYLTSGGKEYVPDGEPGHHSPFAGALIRALQSKGVLTGGMLTIKELRIAVQGLEPRPRSGDFDYGSGDPEGEFFFIPVD